MPIWRRTGLASCLALAVVGLSPVAARAIVSAAPTVSITTPAEGSTVGDLLTVTAVAHVDAAGGDTGQDMNLSVDGITPSYYDLPCPATPDPSLCMVTWQINTVGWTIGQHSLKAAVATADWLISSDVIDVVLPLRPPTARINSPKDASTFVPNRSFPPTPLQVDVQGGRFGDPPGTSASWQLVVDGMPTGVASTCVSSLFTAIGVCFATLPWDAPLAGAHVLVARLTVGTTVVDSAPVTVTVVRPTVVITSPADGAVIDGGSSVVATGTIATPGDTPVSMSLRLNGTPRYPTIPCPANAASPGTCTVSIPFSLGLSATPTTVVVTFLTKQSYGASAPIGVQAYLHRSIVWTDSVAAGPAGRLHTVRGQLRNADAGTAVTLVVTPGVGRPSTRQVVTDAAGAFTVSLRPRSTTTVTATVPGGPAFSAVRTVKKIAVLSTPHCALPTHLTRNTVSLVHCTVAGLPNGVKVGLQFLAHKRWYALRSGFAKHGAVTLPLHWSRAGALYVRVIVGGSKLYATTWGKPVLVKVI